MVMRSSTTYVTVPITGPSAASLVLANISFQVNNTDAIGGTWTPADVWDTTNLIAKLLVGPAGTLPWPAGEFAYVFIKVTSTPETPVMYAGKLVVEDLG